MLLVFVLYISEIMLRIVVLDSFFCSTVILWNSCCICSLPIFSALHFYILWINHHLCNHSTIGRYFGYFQFGGMLLQTYSSFFLTYTCTHFCRLDHRAFVSSVLIDYVKVFHPYCSIFHCLWQYMRADCQHSFLFLCSKWLFTF